METLMHYSSAFDGRRTVGLTILIFILALFIVIQKPGTPTPGSLGNSTDLVQFSSRRHVLGFAPDGVWIAAPDHVLTIGFKDARYTAPCRVDGTPFKGHGSEKALPMETVVYKNLWDNVTLVYEKTAGAIVKSTYHIDPAAFGAAGPAARIQLVYNHPVSIDGAGRLVIETPAGRMTESPPVAWQEVNGQRKPVSVSFRTIDDRTAGFRTGPHDPALPLVIDPSLTWNTFGGSAGGTDRAECIAVDGNGNVYIGGKSDATWGTPINVYTGGEDAFVAKFNNSGALQWHTFLGSGSSDECNAIAVDSSGNVYASGFSWNTWGTPVTAHSGGGGDVFAAKFDSSGTLQWHTFLGSPDKEECAGIAVDDSGNVYVTGDTKDVDNSDGNNHNWGTPVVNFTNGAHDTTDVFVCKLNSAGALQWNTFMGSSAKDYAEGIAVDSSGNVYVGGWSFATWGSPVNNHAGGVDAFAAKLDSSGARQWHTFMGSANNDYGNDIAVDSTGNVYVTGYSEATWGSPVSAFTGAAFSLEVLAAKLNSSGALQWNTFLGSGSNDFGDELVLDASGNIYLSGSSVNTWDYNGTSPLIAHAGGAQDAFALQMDNNGAVQWHAFLGGTGSDGGNGIAVDTCGSVYVAGYSTATWGSSPVAAYTGGSDAFAAMLGSATASTCYSGSSGGSSSTGGGSSSASDPDTITGSTTVQGDVADKTVTAGADVTIGSTGSATNTTVGDGAVVTNQGTMTGTTVEAGGTASNSGDMTDTTVETGGTVTNDGGTMADTTVQSGGTVTNSGDMTGTTVQTGAAVDNTGGQIQDITLASDAQVSGGNITGEVNAQEDAVIQNTVLADNSQYTCPYMTASAMALAGGTTSSIPEWWLTESLKLTRLADKKLEILFEDTGQTLLIQNSSSDPESFSGEYQDPSASIHYVISQSGDMWLSFFETETNDNFTLSFTDQTPDEPENPDEPVYEPDEPEPYEPYEPDEPENPDEYPPITPGGNIVEDPPYSFSEPACPTGIRAVSAALQTPNQAPGTTITGGVLKGYIVGDPYDPALINAQIDDSAILSHVIIGKDSTFTKAATLGYGVKFEDESQIPDMTDLTLLTALANDSMDYLHISYALDLGAEIIYGSGASLMDDMNALPDLAMNGLTLTQNTAYGTVNIYTPDSQFSFQPSAVWQLKTGGTVAGVYLLDDGTVDVVTFNDQMVVLTPMIKQPSQFYDLLISYGAHALGVSYKSGVITALLDFSSFVCVKFKPDAVSTSVDPDDPGQSPDMPYLSLSPSLDAPNVDMLSMVFSEKGKTWEQKLYPAAADATSLKTGLSMMPGVGEKITINHDGTVTTSVNGESFKGLLSYFTHGGTNLSGKMQILSVADQNKDGIEDLKLVYPDGTWQIMYKFK